MRGKTTLKRLDPLSTAKVLGVAYALFGLLFGVMFALFGVVAAATQANGIGAGIGLIFVGLIFYPIGAAISGFVGGLILAVVYNLTASLFGGIEMEWES